MKKSSTIFLQVFIVLLGIAALAFLLLEPQYEGRNVNATQYQIYFNDPFLVWAYIASISFFVALYQGFKLLGYIRENKIFSQHSVDALRTIKYCAMVLISFLLLAEAYLLIVRPEEDIAGGVAMGLFIIIASALVATVAAVFQRTLQNAVDIKSENDLTV